MDYKKDRLAVSDWFDNGVKNNYTHMFIFEEYYDKDDGTIEEIIYPVYVKHYDSLNQVENSLERADGTVLELYDLKAPKMFQINDSRSYNK